jgi:hypothetical protein
VQKIPFVVCPSNHLFVVSSPTTPFVVSSSNHERTRAEFRSFLERVGMTFSRISLRCIRATPRIPFVVSQSLS